MGGKKGVPGAKEKDKEKQKAQAAAAAKAQEEADWAAAGDGKKSKAQAKRGEKDEERQEAAAKKQEARRLAQEEEEALASTAKKKTPTKVTAFELQKQREADARASAQASAQRDQAKRREVGADEYDQMVAAHNDNTEDGIDARNVDAALAQMSVNEEQPKMKFSQYQERELPDLRVQKPGLKAPQYKDILWKKWLRAPENPMNQKQAG